jgi:hypothetical protein
LNRRSARGRPRWTIAPQQVDQAVDRDDLAQVDDQDGQQRPLLRGTKRRERSAGTGLHRPEDPEVHHRFVHAVDLG